MCCVYGEAEPVPEGFRIFPPAPWQYEEDSWLYVEGLSLTGMVVVGLTWNEETKEWGFENVVFDPNPNPPGEWRGQDRNPRRVWWRRVDRKSIWQWILNEFPT